MTNEHILVDFVWTCLNFIERSSHWLVHVWV